MQVSTTITGNTIQYYRCEIHGMIFQCNIIFNQFIMDENLYFPEKILNE